jgi:Rieske 2Fe-2S family protein
MDRSKRLTLSRIEESLPKSYYLDPDHYRRELGAVWYASWIYACRAEEIARSRDFKVVEVGDQSVIVTRDDDDQIQAFHNTCRHRGSVLCTEQAGRFRGPAIVCPYHRWTYSLDGQLRATPYRLQSAGFRMEDYALYPVAVAEWAGFVFIHLGAAPEPFERALGSASERFENWRLGDLRVAHRWSLPLACNWKIFSENFQECLHCPGLHPELSRLVPIYGKGLVSEHELPGHSIDPDDPEAPLAPGAVSWTLDGQSRLPALPHLTDLEKRRGQTFGSLEPGFFLIGHIDYARTTRLLPIGPEESVLSVEWLLPASVLEGGEFDLEHTTALAKRVVEQDARACELNQRGLRSLRHERGVLVSQEYWVQQFHQWLRERLGETT